MYLSVSSTAQPKQKFDSNKNNPNASDFLSKIVQFNVKDKSFEDITINISKNIGVNYILDGDPNVPAISIKIKDKLNIVLDKICDQFDYTWSLSKSNTIVARKRYKLLTSYPTISLPEIEKGDPRIVRSKFDILQSASRNHMGR